jgi:hypothetical protein
VTAVTKLGNLQPGCGCAHASSIPGRPARRIDLHQGRTAARAFSRLNPDFALDQLRPRPASQKVAPHVLPAPEAGAMIDLTSVTSCDRRRVALGPPAGVPAA